MPDKESDSHRISHISSLTLQPIRHPKKKCSQLSRQVEFIEIRRSSRLRSTGGRLEKAKASGRIHAHPPGIQLHRRTESTKCNRSPVIPIPAQHGVPDKSHRNEREQRNVFFSSSNDKLAGRSTGDRDHNNENKKKTEIFFTLHSNLNNEGASNSG